MAAGAKPLTWLVTGASSGFGQSISIAALAAGHKVVGATRDVARAQATNPDFAPRGGIWLQLDPSHPDSSGDFARAQEEHDVDVLVNNAGYSFIGGVEDTSEEEVQDQFDVNFWGPLRAVRAVLPYMRAKGRGHIVLISSGAVYMSLPGRGAYIASKAAIEAIHETLGKEVETLGIKVLVVEPGGFRTSWNTNIKTPAAHDGTSGFSIGYKGTVVEQWVGPAQDIKKGSLPNRIRGDTGKAANEIVRAVVDGHDYVRLFLGSDCVRFAEQRLRELHHDLEATKAIAMSTDEDMSEPSKTKGTMA
ncbi:putative glucose ribitol dehydrogenase [Rosellinia necatrix]|uniref:Putative glucose ribitol dehydrogenase n=1 Tax=Rosellinia necatrix TaxID=77044 RepID=A0A1W2TMI3_ROSNE|nr:putative glucose ribitol dehydrogenase [Rosellinia necatrix]